ncbi:hypothetical protein ACWEJP_22625 [Streptomyces sp. NPDC004749]
MCTVRKLVRTSVAAAGLVAALSLSLTGCGGGDDGSDKDGGGVSSPSGAGADSGSGSGSGPDSGPDGGADSGGLEGSWAGLSDGHAVVLGVKKAKVMLVAAEHVCQGGVEDMGGEPMLNLTCDDGNTDRTMGTIESNDGKKLVVSWEGGKKDTLTKTADGKLPAGEGGLPTDLPKDLPTG